MLSEGLRVEAVGCEMVQTGMRCPVTLLSHFCHTSVTLLSQFKLRLSDSQLQETAGGCTAYRLCMMYRLLYCPQVWDKDVVTDDDVIGRTSWSFCPQEVWMTNQDWSS
jgi:hypothetical protein